MLSFRTAEDATYIAQLLGRMVRTPLGARVTVNESLNEVRMYLPFFNKDRVEDIINELKSNEGEDIPADIESDDFEKSSYRIYSIHPQKKEYSNPDQISMDFGAEPAQQVAAEKVSFGGASSRITQTMPSGLSRDNHVGQPFPTQAPKDYSQKAYPVEHDSLAVGGVVSSPEKKAEAETLEAHQQQETEQIPLLPQLNREEVLEFINSKGYISYNVKDTRVNDYLTSLMDLASLLTVSGIHRDANDEVKDDITSMIHEYAEALRSGGQYSKLKKEIKQMKLTIQIYDIFGDEIKHSISSELFMTDTIIDNQAGKADIVLGKHNYVGAYINRYTYEAGEDARDCQIDCILFAANKDCTDKLNAYAKKKFHALDDEYRINTVEADETTRRRYNKIVAAGDKVSKTILSLPTNLGAVKHDPQGKNYYNHLYVDEETGIAKVKLNDWEEATIDEESKRPDFVCWIRNPSKAQWALRIPYTMDNKTLPMYPDFLIVRTDPKLKYVVDVLEPHGPQYADGLYKAKGMAKYAVQEPRIKRIQMIRSQMDTATGRPRLLRLDFTKGEVRDEIENATSPDDLTIIFKKYGIYED